jgi:hypothetical protein
VISWQGRWENIRTGLRMHSQGVAGWLGFALAALAAWLWHRKIIDEVWWSFLVGVGAAILAAAVVSYLSPYNEAAFRRFLSFGIRQVWLSRRAINEKYWVDHVNGAEEKCILLGIAHGKWCEDEKFLPTVHERLKHNVIFKMLFLNPNSKAAELRAAEEARLRPGRDTINTIRKSIKTMWDFRQQHLEAGLRDRLRLYAYEGTPSCGLMWIDKSMLVTHYLAGVSDVTSPALLVEPPEGGMEGSLYDIYSRNLEELETPSVLITEQNIQQFLPHAPDLERVDDARPSVETRSGGEPVKGA